MNTISEKIGTSIQVSNETHLVKKGVLDIVVTEERLKEFQKGG